jgi:hypothetical protein
VHPNIWITWHRLGLARPASPRFRARLLGGSSVIPGYPAIIGAVLLFGPWRVGAAVIGLALVIALLRTTSRIVVVDGELRGRFFGWSEHVRLGHLTEIRTGISKASIGYAPALRLSDADGNRLSLRLGWWDGEPELLGIVADAVGRSGAWVDVPGAKILRSRPPGEAWDPVCPGDLPDPGATPPGLPVSRLDRHLYLRGRLPRSR